ncbi:MULTISPECIES: hypothetical protein [unclassified Mesorhizobium]|uniref:hypothetical protein n=1 Tax=unclassified Mesorhizobium TaxID=325217 RepID=UPI00143F6546|nr:MULTISPECIES: hypothetical protein [unclassified Mesorhizobium]
MLVIVFLPFQIVREQRGAAPLPFHASDSRENGCALFGPVLMSRKNQEGSAHD